MADTMTSNWNKPESSARSATEKADDAVGSVGSGMSSLAKTLREHAPDSGMLGNVSSRTAESLDSAGRYLRDEGVTGMVEDVTNLVRRNPGPALLAGLGLGFLLSYVMRRR